MSRGHISEPTGEKSSRRDDSFVETYICTKLNPDRDATKCANCYVASPRDAILGCYLVFYKALHTYGMCNV